VDYPIVIQGVEGLRDLLGKTVGPGEWRTVDQDDIDQFAELSGDAQWIHVDRERAATESPYGTTIAHGNLTLSLIDGFRLRLMRVEGVRMGINYGWNKVRFPAPVVAGAKVRASAELISLDELGDGWYQAITRFELEAEDQAKPVCVADSVGRILGA